MSSLARCNAAASDRSRAGGRVGGLTVEPPGQDVSRRAGSALVVVLLALLLVSALGAAMVVLATADTLAAANQRDARVILYAANRPSSWRPTRWSECPTGMPS
jgi:hypothetical protein